MPWLKFRGRIAICSGGTGFEKMYAEFHSGSPFKVS